MSANDTTIPAPMASARPKSGHGSVIARTTLGGVAVAGVVAAAIAFWPPSEADKARDDGEQLGAAVAQLEAADGTAEVDAAQAEISAAVDASVTHAGEAVSAQVADQADALNRAADGYVGSLTTDSDWDYELYQLELDVALDDLYNNAEDFRSTGPEVQQAYWEGYESGVNGD